MFAEIATAVLATVFQFSIVAIIIAAGLVWYARRHRKPWIIKAARITISAILGVFGVFRCHCLDARRPGLCWLWMELENCISTSLAIIFGMIVMGLTISLIPLMLALGVSSIITLSSPVVLYLVYPVTLYFVRRDCH